MMLAHFLTHDRQVRPYFSTSSYSYLGHEQVLLQTIKEWPKEIYDIAAVIVAVHAELDKSSYNLKKDTQSDTILMECLAELLVLRHQLTDLLIFDLDILPTGNLGKPFPFSCASEDPTFLTSSGKTIFSLMYRIKHCYLSSSIMNSGKNAN
jgi:hypothetical protein